MTRIEEIDEIPDWDWGPHTRKEMQLGENRFSYQMVKIIGDEPIAVAGLYYTSFLSVPWFWLAIAEGFYHNTLSNTRRLLSLRPYLPSPLKTMIAGDFAEAVHFAKIFGFVPTDEVYENYQVFRRN